MLLPQKLDHQTKNYLFSPQIQQNPHHDEWKHYHNPTQHGFCAILSGHNGRKYQRSYKLDQIERELKNLDLKKEHWFSQGEFCYPDRRVVHLARINLAFVDLDYYHIPSLQNLTPHQVAGQIRQHCDDYGLPTPSIIVSSGQGLYLKWILSSAVPRAALPRWNALERHLVDCFSKFGADPKAKDASRVLRLEGTVNHKIGKVVKVIFPASPLDPVVMYGFEELCQEILPANRTEATDAHIRELDRIKQKKLKLINGGGNPRNLRPKSAIQLNWDRLEDLRRLAEWRGGVRHGMRDFFFFLAVCFSAWTLAPHTLRQEIEALGKEFAPGLSKNEIQGYAGSALEKASQAAMGKKVEYEGGLVDARYRFKNSTLIELLEITPSEEHQLQTIISSGEAKRRHASREQERRRALGAIDRASYLEKCNTDTESKRIEARLRRAKGESLRQIASAVGCSVSTAHGYISKED